jgi:O-acetylhomoserine (thiol)-lyase
MTTNKRGFTTSILHSDRSKPIEHGALHKPIHNSVAYAYADARELAAVFQGRAQGYRYGRQGNPTVSALEDKITLMEGGVGTICFATGMAAIGALVQAYLRAGDHVVASAFLFGNTASLLATVAAQGCSVDFVDATDAANVLAAIKPETRIVFVETIANPRTQVADLEGIGELCRERGLLYVVDNTMTSPYLFLPKSVGATHVVNALTKYIGGHGNALGGAVTDTGLADWSRYPHLAATYQRGPAERWGLNQMRAKSLRDWGASLAPEAAHHLALGAETLALRLERTCATAGALARALQAHPKVKAVHYPGLEDHPQHQRARTLFKAAGGILSFELADEIDCFDFLNRLKIAAASSNLGDNRSLVIPVSHTIFYELGPERRAAMGIAESLIRVSVGIEETEDVVGDFLQALS